MSISGEIRQQVTAAVELSKEARDSAEEAAELVDSVATRLTALLSASHDPAAAQAVRSLVLAQQGLAEVAGLFGWVAAELPVFLARLDRPGDVPATGGAPVATPHRPSPAPSATIPRPGEREEADEETKPFMAWWGTRSREIADAGSAEGVIGEAADRIFNDGPRGVAIRIGDGVREEAPLRIYLDTAAGRAAVSWQGSPGIESDVKPGEPLLVEESPKLPPVTIPADRARVRPATAIRAAREYVETGRRPTCLDWAADPPPPPSEPVSR